jgi:hypothetical protein
MSGQEPKIVKTRDAVIGKQYSYNGYGTLKKGQVLGTLLKLTHEFNAREPGGREPAYFVEFSHWKGSLDWDDQLREIERTICWT